MNIDPWLVSLVGSKSLGLWIDSTIFAIESQFDELLLGATLSDERKSIEQMLRLNRHGPSPKLTNKKVK